MPKDYKRVLQAIKKAYTEGTSMEDAEKLAAKFWHASYTAATELRNADLDARMKKAGYKAIRSAAYIAEASKDRGGDKRPTVDMLEALVTKGNDVKEAQERLDRAENERDSLVNFLTIFREGHIYFRGIAKGNFNG